MQSVNRPVAAVQNLQKSIELNENRAIYRSKLLLDEDLATRDTSLARVYEDLGFDQLAQIEASKSLTLNPANYSAHRFLSDSYATRPRHEIARVSELLQAQLLQPLNINPVQPSLNETNLRMINGFDTSTLNEYTSLFERDRTQVLISGIAGNNTTLADEIVLSGLQGPISYSLGQFHYETEGFRANNDLKHDIFNPVSYTHLDVYKRQAWINLLLCVLLGPFRAAFAGDAGEIVSVVGSVEVRREGRWQPLKPGEILAVGAVLKTAAGSRVALQLANGSQIKLNANCELELKKIAPRELSLIHI